MPPALPTDVLATLEAGAVEPRAGRIALRSTATPGEPPVQTSEALSDTLFFVVNFSFATLFFIACVISIAAADNPFAFLGGVIAVLPVACYVVAEWFCWYRQRRWLLRPLGILNLSLAAFFVFGLVTNIGEAITAEDPVNPLFILLFGFGFAVVAGYLGWCGWRRVHAVPPTPVDSMQG